MGKPVLIPVPVPIYVPVPMRMYTTPVPHPMPIPVPIPFPCFIPTTKKNTESILKHVKVRKYYRHTFYVQRNLFIPERPAVESLYNVILYTTISIITWSNYGPYFMKEKYLLANNVRKVVLCGTTILHDYTA